jgi:outer membrane protein insertion porin family
MQILRVLGIVLLFLATIISPIQAKNDDEKTKESPKTESNNKPPQQQLVESVDIQGNRRLRDDDLLYYIKTRPGDVYDAKQLERDLKELLSLNFFDKTATKVYIEDGVRGGVNVIFEVKELPIIRDLQFKGTKAITESDILKSFREQRVGVSKESIYDPVKKKNATRVVRELLAAKGYPNATVDVTEEEVSATSIALIFNITQGERSRIVKIQFEGLEHFKSRELRAQLKLVQESNLISRFKGQDVLFLDKLMYDLDKNVRPYMASKGYYLARFGEPKVEGLGLKRTSFIPYFKLPIPLVTSKDDTLKVIIPITEGKLFRVGDIKVEGNSIISSEKILQFIGLKKGEVIDGKRLREAVYEDLKKVYGSQGFVQYDGEIDADYKDNPTNLKEGVIDVTINIDEGKQFTLRRLEFGGNTFTRDGVLRREMLVNEGDIYNQNYLDISVARLNQLGYFDPIDKDKDVETRTDEENGAVDLLVKVKEKGRQQISFNGGVSGIGGTFFGLEYSTNNLLGRGEVLSLTAGAGNRQSNFQFSFTEPYFKDRPISVGFSLFASRSKFFGEGTFLSQNTNLFYDASNPYGTVLTDQENLFTQTTLGATVFATAPLSELFFKKRSFTQFSRVGLNYQFSATSIKDPPVNASNNAATLIPVIYRQPNITTSQVSASFVYDTRQPSANGIDTLKGQQISAQVSFAGLGGDVRTYQPTISWTNFIPVRRKKSQNAEVFGFRIQAGTIGSWALTDKIRNANSLSFIGGVPYYGRYFLGSEYDLRGYQARSVGPIAPVDTYVTTRNVVVARNIEGTPETVPGLDPRDAAAIAALGTFTGESGANPARISRSINFIGGDTQLLGNFEYRIPIFGPVSLAAFADIGSTFNLRKGSTQEINSNFLPDQPFLGIGNDISSIFLRNNTQFQPASPFFGGLLIRDGRPITRREFQQLLCASCAINPITGLPLGLETVYLRGDAQTNTRIRIGDSAFNKIGDFRSSVGLELRVQVPIVNVPFRLIYYINPNSRYGTYENVPGYLFQEKKRGWRFTVGRTF